MRLRFLGTAFVLTGAGALVIEQAFEKLLTTIVGGSVDAGAIVLGVYFLGMSVGAACFHRLRARAANGAVLYAALEAIIGAWALVLGTGFSAIQAGSAAAIQLAGESGPGLFLARTLVAACWIAPPTVAMGASFPAMVSWLRSHGGDVDRRASTFYTLNVVGAFLGAAGAAYLLFPRFGLQVSLLLVGAVELGIAAAVFVFARHERVVDEAAAQISMAAVFRSTGARRPLLAAFASGFIVFSFEVLWLHLGGVTIGMSAYSFAGVLVVVLLGLFIGGSIAAAIPTTAEKTLPVMFAIATAALVVVYPMWDDVPGRFIDFRGVVHGFWSGEAVRLLLLASVVGVPSLALGLVYPTILRLPVAGVPRDGLVAGLGLANGVGSIIGALLVGFVLIGAIGSEGTYRLLLGLVVVALVVSAPLHRTWPSAVAGFGLLGLLTSFDVWDRLALTSGANVYFSPGFVHADSQLVFWHEDNSGGVTTIVRQGGQNTLLTNGKFQGNDSGEMVDQASFSLVPIAMTAGRDRALVIGLGTGQSAYTIASAGFASVDVAEIADGMVEAAKFFSVANGDVLQRPEVHLKIGDGRNLLMRERGTYDLISMEITSMWFAGAANLYSTEFYTLASSRLAPLGVLQQWLQLHHIGSEELVSTLTSVREVFPHVSLWMVGRQGIIIASQGPLPFVPERLQTDGLAPARALLAGGGVDIAALGDRLLLDEHTIEQLVTYGRQTGTPLNTDANRHLEFMSPRYNTVPRDMMIENLKWMHDFVEGDERKKRVVAARKRTYGE